MFQQRGRTSYRTDVNYHLTFKTDGQDMTTKYSHFCTAPSPVTVPVP